jgi:hypothetical protein
MGWFSALKTVVNVLTLGQSGLIEKEIEIGGRILQATIDPANEVVRVGEDIFRKAPGELFYPGLGPLAGLLKNEVEDELILLNPLGIVPGITVYIDGALVVGSLLGVVQHRRLVGPEVEVAEQIFGDSIERLGDIRLTNLTGLDGNAFAAPSLVAGAILSMGAQYRQHGPVDDIPLLAHELTHAWQMQRSLIIDLAVCVGIITKLRDLAGDDQYSYTPGEQWEDYGTEQQAEMVEDWVYRSGPNNLPMRVATPLFRYINGNVRTGKNAAHTAGDRRLSSFLAEANADTLRDVVLPGPTPWWP